MASASASASSQSVPTSASASSQSVPPRKYDVFLSFRGKDVRKTFLGHLYSALNQGGFKTYKDDNGLARGCDIVPSLLEAIEQSRIAIIVFSRHYAESTWCLDELVKILDCRDKFGLMVLPIFFHVAPSDVRNQKGRFGKVFERNKKKVLRQKKVTVEQADKWKTDLTNAANLAGFDLQSVNGDESELIKRIIEDVLEKLHPSWLSDAIRLFGTEFAVEKITSLLRLGFKLDVCSMGFYGKLQIGKSIAPGTLGLKTSHWLPSGLEMSLSFRLYSPPSFQYVKELAPVDYALHRGNQPLNFTSSSGRNVVLDFNDLKTKCK